MSAAVALIAWTVRRELFGPGSGAARAAFGRYVAAKGAWMTLRSGGPEAYRAWRRAYLPNPGYLNRSYRRRAAAP